MERFQASDGSWGSRKHDITLMEVTNKDGEQVLQRPAMLFDFHSAANCWIRFKPYDEIVVAIDGELPPRPLMYRDENGNAVNDQYGKPIQHQQMARVPVFSPLVFGKDEPLHELSARGDTVLEAIRVLFENQVEQNPDYIAGKLPLIQWAGSEATGKKGDLFVPTFKILGWHARPGDVPLEEKPKRVAGATAPQGAARPAPTKSAAELDDDIPF